MITSPPHLVLKASSAAGAVAAFSATATDNIDGPVPVQYSHAPNSVFPLGTTTVTVSAVDSAGNQSTASFTVTVRDTTPPTMAPLTFTPNVLSPPNHKMVAVVVAATASDSVGVASLSIISVTSNEPASADRDIVLTGPLTLNVRADRAGSGNGRIYTIAVQARDTAGNATSRTATVIVPRDQGGK